MSLRDLVRRETGLDLSESVIARAVARRMSACGSTGAADYAARMTPEEFRLLTELLVVPESWMFRDAEAFAAAAAFVQRRLAASPARAVRLLSIPCAGGEEPYSMAMALQDAGVAGHQYRIDAVDLSDVALARARRGRYTKNAFRGHNLAFRERYFTREGNEYQIDAAMRAQVRFSQGNLLAADAAPAGGYDVVFCRNLLIYFDEPTVAAAIARLDALLLDDGLLFAGYAEVPAFCRNGFATFRAAGAFALQKARAAGQPQPVPPAACAAPARAARPPVPPVPRRQPPRPAAAAPKRAPAAAPAATDWQALLGGARKLADQGDYENAAAACLRVLEANPGAAEANAEAYFILGMLSECDSNPAAAEDYWRRCVYLRPDHYDALCHLALLAGGRGDAAQAAAFRQRAARVWERGRDGVRKGTP